MLSINLFTASEARANLSRILKLAAAGEEVVIVNKENTQRFRISLVKPRTRSRHIENEAAKTGKPASIPASEH
jgi:antitoxin (DNA-binding transcriptional repressor) of toxin-antitoxin stability system